MDSASPVRAVAADERVSMPDPARIDRLARDIALLQARADLAAQRDAELVSKVSAAKGRIAVKPEVEGKLEELQKSTHQRSVGAFEQMLTAITNDVLPDLRAHQRIGLELYSDRNMPALDIFYEQGGQREAITSGAVANIVSTGLRFIALARSGARRFMLLDEADCWMNDASVPNYFNVVNQLSRDAGIQTLIITHHDLADFSDSFRVYRIAEVDSGEQWPARTLELINPGRMDRSDLQEDTLAWLQADNFESFVSARVDLAPGVTAITGPNGRGKSGWARLLRAAFLGDAGDEIIRHGKPSATVSIGFSDGRVLQHRRVRKGTPKAEFILHSADSYAGVAGALPLHNSPTARVPEWVPAETGVREIDGINVQLWGQLKPVFMLDDPPSKRASLLAIGRESGYLHAMSDLYKDDVRADNTAIREGEKEIASLRLARESYAPLAGASESAERLRSDAQLISDADNDLKQIGNLLTNLEAARAALAHTQAQQLALSRLPEVPSIEPTDRMSRWLEDVARNKADSRLVVPPALPPPPVLESTDDVATLLDSIRQARLHSQTKAPSPPPQPPVLEETSAIGQLLADMARAHSDTRLPAVAVPAQPAFEDTATASQLLEQMRGAQDTLRAARAQAEGLARDLTAIEARLQQATETLGNECPVCHSLVDVDMLLGRKEHKHARLAP